MAVRDNRPEPDCVKAWADAFGFPESYVSVDCETSGLDVDRDFILQLGWCRVVAAAPTENAGVVIGHQLQGVEATLLDTRLNQTRQAMEKRGLDYKWTTKILAAVGRPPKEAVETFIGVCDQSDAVVAHYGVAFDYPMIDRLCRRECGVGLPPVESGQLYDTAILFKAAVIEMKPMRDESIASAMARVLAVRGSTKFSVSKCVEVFDLAKKGVVKGRAHDAIYDAWVASLIFEELRAMAR